VGGVDGVRLVERLATALGGVLGASRAVVDAGWVPYAHQVGQTGSTVQPKLYVACGVSGAIQHIVGMQNSDRIVAINRDPEAAIFRYADVGVVGDVMDVVPALLHELEVRHKEDKGT
jgi:electron transfer flavoprotein alpha subunit